MTRNAESYSTTVTVHTTFSELETSAASSTATPYYMPAVAVPQNVLQEMTHKKHSKKKYPEIKEPNSDMATKTFAFANGTAIPMTAPTQTMSNGQVVTADPLAKYKAFDPRKNPVAPTAHCLKGNDTRGRLNHTECQIEKCMFDYLKPLDVNVITKSGQKIISNHSQTIHDPHWGMGKWHGHQRNCTDVESCHALCVQRPVCCGEDDPNSWANDPRHQSLLTRLKALWWAFLLSGLVAWLMGVLSGCCCGIPALRRRERTTGRRSTLLNRIDPDSSTTGNTNTNNQTTGTNTLAGPAAGVAGANANQNAAETNRASETGSTGSATDGRGTMGRSAEEGRSRVAFKDPAASDATAVNEKQGGTGPGSTVMNEKQASAADTSATGSQAADMGSVRGRKTVRPEGN